MTNYNEGVNSPIDEESKMNADLIQIDEEPPVHHDSDKDILDNNGKTKSIVVINKTKVHCVTTQPKARISCTTTLENIMINPGTIDLKTLDEESRKILRHAIQEYYWTEDTLKALQFYFFGVFDCMLFTFFAMHGFCCCPHYPMIPMACPLPM